MQTTAVFIIDMLNDCFGHERLNANRASLCSAINELTALAHAKKIPVFWIRQEFEPDLSDAFLDMRRDNIQMFIKGTSGPQILDELVRRKEDREIVKKRYSMFHGTGLDEILRSMNVNHLVLAGVNSHACIRMAAIDAFQRDFNVTIVRECVDSKDPVHHEVTMNYMDGGIASIVSINELEKLVS